ncbi:MAG TPA: protein kinase [Thermoanaerobaculia bacterium]|nr:protein kinase [Thermoanaerobaculia bacterium]
MPSVGYIRRMPLAPGTHLGAYEIVAPLGKGGMGEVYRAHDPRLRRDIALKVLPEEVASSSERVARFEREARIVASLNHPNIVTLHSIEETAGTRFLTMELIEGRTLADLVTPGGLPLAQVLDLIIPLADALAAAHEKGVVHRDIKPTNVMVTHDGRVKVLDFGVAKLVTTGPGPERTPTGVMASPLSRTGELLGTVPYMAPEQVFGEAADARTDLFSLGILIFELVTGQRPFVGTSVWQAAAAIMREPPPVLSRVRPDVPGELEGIVMRCLEKQPGDRFQTARDLANELHALTDTVERGALPAAPSAGERLASIAVLPFDNLSGDPEQEYFADGIVEEIITGLSRIKWLLVISRNSTFSYKGKPIDVKAVGRNLGVRYVLQGSVRRSGKHVRVTARLIATETAANVWADRYDATLADIFALQDELTISVIGAVEPTLRKAEVERVRRKRPDSLDAYDLFLRALPFTTTAMPGDAEKALHFLQEAVRLEPNYAAVHGLIAWCHEQRYLRGGLHAEARRAGLVHAHAAIEMGSDDAMALAMGGFTLAVLERDYQSALEAIDRSLALSPSSALAFGFSSIVRAWLGEDSTAIEHARMGIRLSPYDQLVYIPYVGLTFANLFTGNFVEAASSASRAAAANPRFSVPRYLHTVALVHLGRLDEAKAMANVVLELQPGFTISGLCATNFTTPERLKILAEALHRAGLPD